jgi:hypothetical protein
MSIAIIAKKLRLDVTKQLLIMNAPEAFSKLIKGFAYDKQPSAEKKYDFIQVFAITQTEMEALLKQASVAATYDCLFWACYPKGTGKIKSELKRESIWHALSLVQLQAVSAIAIDETWSALRGRPPEMIGKK